MNERLRTSGIEEGLEYFLVSSVQVLTLYRLGDMAILLEHRFLAVLHEIFLYLTFRVDAHFSLMNQPLCTKGFLEDLDIPPIQSSSSNSIRARRYHNFAKTSILGI